MKILISADMEGISGVTHPDHVNPSHPEYARFRRLMTAEVNAAIRGAAEAGAQEFVVTDGHAYGSNILIEELDARAVLNTGTPTPFAMVQGVDRGVDAVFFIGYHARAGTNYAILDHTWASRSVSNLWLNDMLVGEIGLNAAVCGHFNTAVILVSGDRAACKEAQELLGPVEIAAVKYALTRTSAECMHPSLAQQKICEAAANAVYRLQQKTTPPVFRLPAPVDVTIEFQNSALADRAAFLPGSTRLEGKRIRFQSEDMFKALKGFRAAVDLSLT